MSKEKEAEWQRLKLVLDERHQYPTDFLFKFIIPSSKKADFDKIFPTFVQKGYQMKPSSGGKYTSITISVHVHSSEEILEIYGNAQQIDGLIAL